MMPGADLTRWNRAGLSRFRYVGGNAITFLELLRAALAERFGEWREVGGGGLSESEDEALARITAQYEAAPGSYGWEIVRTLARAGYVLAEHLDAYANESYLGTATQWDNVRKLVEMLDYRPAPPASAVTSLVLQAKANQDGLVDKGLQVQHVPENGDPPVVFETLEDLQMATTLNELRLADWNRSPLRLRGSRLELEGELEDLDAGSPLILEDETSGALEARLIRSVVIGKGKTAVRLASPSLDAARLRAGWTRIHVLPADDLDPIGPVAKGAELERGLYLEEPPKGLRPGEVIFIGDGKNAHYRRVTRVSGRLVVVDREIGQLHVDDAFVSRARVISISNQVEETRARIAAVRVVGDLSILSNNWIADLKTSGGSKRLVRLKVMAADYQPIDPDEPDSGFTTIRISDPDGELDNPQALYAPPVTREFEVDTYWGLAARNPLPLALLTESPKKTAADDLVAVVSGRMLAWGRLDSVVIDDEKNTGTLQLKRWRHRSGAPFFIHGTRVFGHFDTTARVVGWKENRTPVSGSVLPLSALPGALQVGRDLLIAKRRGTTDSGWLRSKVIEIREASASILVKPGLSATAGFTRSNTVVFGNVVQAGHGASQAPRVLGSGDATLSNARYVVEKEGVSFIADATQPSGVRADIAVEIDGRTWKQVPTLRTSKPTDPHYASRMTEDEFVELEFGDGRHGRRLPSGTNNMRVTYRLGNGLAGNLSAGSLDKLVRPHRQVESVRQPMAATGGNDMESADSMRKNAPRSILTLQRAVSLADFANLAARQSSVWQARAFSLPTTVGRHDSVEVVVVPANGGQLGGLGQSLRAYLEQHALPGVEVKVSRYHVGAFELEVTIRVQSAAYDPSAVEEAVRKALLDVFKLSRRGLGQDLFLSEVYAAVEAVTGVKNSRCVIDRDPELRRRKASPREVVFLRDSSGLRIRSEEFSL